MWREQILATTEELTLWLSQAEAARHKLATGKSVTLIRDQNGEQVQFKPASMRELNSYILELKTALGVASSHGPIRFVF